LERVKAIRRNAATAAAAEAEPYRPELIAEDEPRYLRRQKPVEIRRKKFAGKGWSFYRQVLGWSLLVIALAVVAALGLRFLLYSPTMLLLEPDQIELAGNKVVAREVVLQQFIHDRNRSVLQIPLDIRRAELQKIPWVESATVQRILPNRIRIELTERTPVAFSRNGNELSLIDGHGVILDRPEGEDLHFPIVGGVSADIPDDQRERRMQLYQEFIRDMELVRGGSSEDISEVDLSDPKDLRVVMTGLSRTSSLLAITIHFGGSDFKEKYRKLVENFSEWQAKNGCFRSIDLRYKYPVINPEPGGCSAK
jgi:cell division protein FtsQ